MPRYDTLSTRQRSNNSNSIVIHWLKSLRLPTKSTFLVLLISGSCLLPFIRPRHQYGVSAASDDDDDGVANVAPFVVAGYLPDYRAYINVNATAIHLTDLMLFSLTPESIMQSSSSSPSEGGCCLSPDHYDQIRKARSYKREQQHSEKIRLLVTIGGAGRSNGFRDVVTGGSRVQREFLRSLVKMCRNEELDGIDLDFEGIKFMAEWNAYLKFLSTASTYLHRHGQLLTVAVHPGQSLPPEVCRNVDRVHVMTYDMIAQNAPSSRARGASHDERASHHASLRSAHDALSVFIRDGCRPSKLVMGIPAYGRHERNPGLVKTYSEVVDEIVKKDGHDGDSVRSVQTWNGYQFDSPRDVEAKVKYAVENGLGGVFFWELGQDKQMAGVADGGLLLEAAANLGRGMLHDGYGVEKEPGQVTSPARMEL